MSAISSIFIKTLWFFFLVKDLTNRVLFTQAQSFWEHTFLARMRRLKNGWPLSAPPRAYFYHPQLLKKFFGKSWNQTAFTKKEFQKFWWKLKEYKPYPYPAGTFGPPPNPLGLNKKNLWNWSIILKAIHYKRFAQKFQNFNFGEKIENGVGQTRVSSH